MNKEHFFVSTGGEGGSEINSAYNSDYVSSSLTGSKGGGFSKSSNSNSTDTKKDTGITQVVKSSGFFGLENLSEEKSFCLFNASKSYLNCLSNCSSNNNDSCKYSCATNALDDVQYCIYYEEPEEEEEEEEIPEEETMSSLERMEKLDGSVFMPYSVYDVNALDQEHLVNLKLENGIQFAQLSPDFKTSGGELINTEKPYLLWRG
jgi:hypothetical protein